MKKIALSLILACGVAMATEANATDANATAASAGNAEAGKAAYAKCVSCHGAKAEKKALGKSDVIAGWDAAKTLEILKAYKNGTHKGKGMEGVMKGQVAALSDEDMKALADYIATLK